MQALEAFDWPGNVRELENTMERAVVLETSAQITLASLPERVRNGGLTALRQTVAAEARGMRPGEGFEFEKMIGKAERDFLMEALERAKGVQVRAAELLGMSYRSFRHYAKKHNL